MSTSTTTTPKTLGVVCFHTMERDDIAFCESLREHGLEVSLIGTHPEITSYEFTARKVGEKSLKDSDISLEDALKKEEGFDVLIIPSGPGAGSVENVQGVTELVKKAKKVIAMGWGIMLLGDTGELAGKNATADEHFFYGVGLRAWQNTNWQRDPPYVQDGKFITTKNAQRKAILPLIVPSASAPSPTPPSGPPSHEIDSIAPSDLTPWQSLLKRLREHANHLVETSDVQVSQEVLADDPLLRPAASEEEVRGLERRLGLGAYTALPEDYKEFLGISNGLGFSGDTSIPSLVRVDDLNWQSTDVNDTGLESLSDLVDFPGLPGGDEIQPHEREAMPALQRVLVLSDEDEEVTVGMFDPAWVRMAKRAICEARGVEWDEPKEAEWITFLFVPYAASFDQYGSFKEYIESLLA